MRALTLIGFIALAFGLGARYATGQLGLFSQINLGLGILLLLGAGIHFLTSMGRATHATGRRILVRHFFAIFAALVLSVSIERGLALRATRFDLTPLRDFELAPATLTALKNLPGEIDVTLFYALGDPRIERTRLLLKTFAQHGPLRLHERDMNHAGDEMEQFELGSSNSVALEFGTRFETTTYPTEGTLLEALLALSTTRNHSIYIAAGDGEYDFKSTDSNNGFSGLAAALQNEGFRLHELLMASITEIPRDAALVIFASPQHTLRDTSVNALRDYLARGGRLLVLQDPGYASGLEPLLHEYGIEMPDGIVLDPTTGPVQGTAVGSNPIVTLYTKHPITQGLNSRTATLFSVTRPIVARYKPDAEDHLVPLVFASERAWVTDQFTAARLGRTPEMPASTVVGGHALAVAGSYPRQGGEIRIVVFGDSDFASNQYLRALYNLDLVLNAVHWLTATESQITLRPKEITPRQNPLTPQDTLKMFYGVGMLLPEILLACAALAWSRRFSE